MMTRQNVTRSGKTRTINECVRSAIYVVGSKQNRRGYLLHQHSRRPSELTGPWEGRCAYLGHDQWNLGSLRALPNTKWAPSSGNPTPRLVIVARGLSDLADNPSFEAASLDPLSGSRWQALCHCSVCLSTAGVQTRLLVSPCTSWRMRKRRL